MINNASDIMRWIKVAAQPDSLEEELSEDWEAWVARPCIETTLAPRQARAILEVAGFFASYGVDVADLIRAMVYARQCKIAFMRSGKQRGDYLLERRDHEEQCGEINAQETA